MAEVEGTKIERLISEGMSSGSSSEEIAGAIKNANEEMKNFARGTTQAVNSLGAMIEAMHKSGSAFQNFQGVLEKTSFTMFAFAKSIGDVSSSLKGAVSGTEGFSSALESLATKTFPSIMKSAVLASSSLGANHQALEKEKTKIDEVIESKKKNISIMSATLTAWAKAGESTEKGKKALYDYADKVDDLKNNTLDLEKQSSALNDKLKKSSSDIKAFGLALTTALGWITLLIAATIGVAKAYDVAIKAKREVIYMLGRVGVSYAQNVSEIDKFNASFTKTANQWGMLREEMAKAVAPLTAIGAGVGAGGINVDMGKMKETLLSAADITGGMLRGFGIDVGITTKTLGTLSTGFDITGKALGETFVEIANRGKESALGMQGYITQVTSLADITRRFGGSIEGSMITMSAWSEEVKKGTISIDNLARLTSPAMMSTEQKGGIAMLMKQLAPESAKKLGIKGQNILEDIYQMEKSAKDDPAAMAKGIIELNEKLASQGKGMGERAVMFKEFLQATTGIQMSSFEASEALRHPKKLEELIKKGQEQKVTMNDLLADSKLTFQKTETFQERLAGAVDSIRDVIVGSLQPALDFYLGTKITSTPPSEHVIGSSATKLEKYMESGRATNFEESFIKGVLPTLKKGGWVKDNDSLALANLLKKITEDVNKNPITEKEINRKQRFTKETGVGGSGTTARGYAPLAEEATGGYIPQTGNYLLHAGEQVRKVGAGSGGDVSVNLGGIKVSVGDRGDIKEQLDEAFTRLKVETLREIETQWEQMQFAH